MADLQKKMLWKVVLLGDMGVGKTTLLNSYVGGGTGGNKPTMGPDFRNKRIDIANVQVSLQLWDTAGQE